MKVIISPRAEKQLKKISKINQISVTKRRLRSSPSVALNAKRRYSGTRRLEIIENGP